MNGRNFLSATFPNLFLQTTENSGMNSQSQSIPINQYTNPENGHLQFQKKLFSLEN